MGPPVQQELQSLDEYLVLPNCLTTWRLFGSDLAGLPAASCSAACVVERVGDGGYNRREQRLCLVMSFQVLNGCAPQVWSAAAS